MDFIKKEMDCSSINNEINLQAIKIEVDHIKDELVIFLFETNK